MSSLEEAQKRFAQAMEGLERALAAVRARQDAQQAVEQELALLKTRHIALEAEHADLQKSYQTLRRQQQVIAKRLDGTISSLREVLSA